jgi:TolA-binding protein
VKARECDRGWEGDALREGRLSAKDAESFERHRGGCALCKESHARDQRLSSLALASSAQPAPLVLRRVRARVLRDFAASASRPARPLDLRIAAATAIGVVVLGGTLALLRARSVGSPGDPAAAAAPTVAATVAPTVAATFAGSVVAGSGTEWSRTREEQVERVDLETGTLRVHVRAQRPGERFLVVLPDGELEVRGTTFEVSVVNQATASVRVDEGTVELRLRGRPAQRIGAGSDWTAPASLDGREPPPVTAAPSASPVVSARLARSERPRASDDGAPAYADAMRLFQNGQYEGAAAAFHAFVLAHSRQPEAEDASFLEAVALAKAGRPDAAALAADRHLESFPRSFHRREASILVARAASVRDDAGR